MTDRSFALRTALAGIAIGAALALPLFATNAMAGCDNRDRPAVPTDLTVTQGRAPGSFTLFWTNHQTRTGLTYFDIHVRGPNGESLADLTGDAPQSIRAGSIGYYSFANIRAVSDYFITMRARTAPRTGGCVSIRDSDTLHFRGPLGGNPNPRGLPGQFPGNVGR